MIRGAVACELLSKRAMEQAKKLGAWLKSESKC
jgi:hypothetical protein